MTDLKSVMAFVGQDDDDFDVTEFVKTWPENADDQRMALAMLVVRNGRKVTNNTRQLNRLWTIVTFTSFAAILALALTQDLDPVYAIASAALASGIAQFAKIFSL